MTLHLLNNEGISSLIPAVTEWRRALHRAPELLYDLPLTAAFVAEKLQAFGLDQVLIGIGRSGVVGTLHGRGGAGEAIALRADMDALPIAEASGKPWASTIAGRMHACGHDGHTAMLLGAAAYLAERRHFAGTVVFIFQPAEEGGGGARAMIEDGLFRRVPGIRRIFGMHNLPGLTLGRFAIKSGPVMAAADRVTLTVEGRGGHAALPQQTLDPVLIGAHIVTAAQAIVARSVSPLEAAVVSFTQFHAGTTDNVIPQTAQLSGTIRTLDGTVREEVAARLTRLAEGIAAAHGARAHVSLRRGYPVTVNDPAMAACAREAAAAVVGEDHVETAAPLMGAEDFAYFLEQRPGAFIFLGNGSSAGLHHPAYDFDDEALFYGIAYWVKLVEMLQNPS